MKLVKHEGPLCSYCRFKMCCSVRTQVQADVFHLTFSDRNVIIRKWLRRYSRLTRSRSRGPRHLMVHLMMSCVGGRWRLTEYRNLPRKQQKRDSKIAYRLDCFHILDC